MKHFSDRITAIAIIIFTVATAFSLSAQTSAKNNTAPKGFDLLFNGKNFKNWKLPEGDNGHWKVLGDVIDYDAESEAPGDKNLWTTKKYKNFTLYVDWRIKETPFISKSVPIILPSGLHKLDENGNQIRMFGRQPNQGG